MNCPLCQSAESNKYIEPYHWRKTKQVFTVAECGSCGHLYTKDAPSEDEIAPYYDSETYISHTDNKTTLFDRLYGIVKQYMLTQKWKWIRADVPRGTIVDYGAGSGAFVHFLRSIGRDAEGYEMAEAGRDTAKRNYNIDLFEPNELSDLEDASVAAFTMWHVLEHIYNPNELVEQMHAKLKKDGLLVVAVPNPESWDAKKSKSHWAAWDVPIHISHFKPSVIESWLNDKGFDCIRRKGMPFDAFYVSMISNENETGSKKIITSIWHGLRSNLNGIRRNNHSSLVYILRKRS